MNEEMYALDSLKPSPDAPERTSMVDEHYRIESEVHEVHLDILERASALRSAKHPERVAEAHHRRGISWKLT